MEKSNPNSSAKPKPSPEQVRHLLSDLRDLHELGALKLAPGNEIRPRPGQLPARSTPPQK